MDLCGGIEEKAEVVNVFHVVYIVNLALAFALCKLCACPQSGE